MRMDYYQISVTSCASFAAQMAKQVRAPMVEVESSKYSNTTKEHQRALSKQVVKIYAKGEAARSVRAQEEGPGSTTAKQ